MNLNRASYSSTVAVPVDLLGEPWVGDGGGELASHYYRARYYDSKLGRFIGEDPVGAVGLAGHGESPNLYPYAGNTPVVKVDPTGLVACIPTGRKQTWNRVQVKVGKWVLKELLPPMFGATPGVVGTCVWIRETDYNTLQESMVEELCVSSMGCLPAFSTRWTPGGNTVIDRRQVTQESRTAVAFVRGSYYCRDPDGNWKTLPGGPPPG